MNTESGWLLWAFPKRVYKCFLLPFSMYKIFSWNTYLESICNNKNLLVKGVMLDKSVINTLWGPTVLDLFHLKGHRVQTYSCSSIMNKWMCDQRWGYGMLYSSNARQQDIWLRAWLPGILKHKEVIMIPYSLYHESFVSFPFDWGR